MNFQRYASAWAFVLTVCLSPMAAEANSVVQAATCTQQTSFRCISGITDLVILGQHYDVTVTVGKFSELFPTPGLQLATWGDAEFSSVALQAMTSTINAQLGATSADTKFYDVGSDPRYETILHLPQAYDYFNGNPQGAFQGPCAVLDVGAVLSGSCSIWLVNEPLAFAVFTPAAAAVPEPATGWLATCGLLMLAGLVKRGARRPVR